MRHLFIQFFRIKKYMKRNLFFFSIGVVSVIFILEIFSRIFFSIASKSIYPIFYGFNKDLTIYVEDLSELNFTARNTSRVKIKSKNNNYYPQNKKIWIFGGSTSTSYCDESSWPNEIQKYLPNYEIINFSTYGGTTDSSINTLFKNKNKDLPEKIFWANRHNEYFFLFFGNSRNNLILDVNKTEIKKNNLLYFVKQIDLSLKRKSVFYFLFDDLIKRISFKISGPKDNIDYEYNNKDIDLIIRNYEINTENAIKFAKDNDIEFYIISLFGKYDFETQKFYSKSFYNRLHKKMKNLKNKWKVNFIDTEKNISFDKNISYFCDNIHQLIEANKLTAKIVFNNL